MKRKIVFILAAALAGTCVNTRGQTDIPVYSLQKTELLGSAEGITEKIDAKQTRLDPNLLYLLLIAEMAGQKGQPRLALDTYMRVINQVDDTRIMKRVVRIALFLKAYAEARAVNERWLKNDPENLISRKVAAMLALLAGEKASAFSHLNFLVGADPAGFGDSMLEIVSSLSREGKTKLMLEVLDKLSITHPDQPAIYYIQSVLALQRDNADLALQKIEKALHIQPDWSEAVILQAQIVGSLGDTEKAINILLKAVKNWPGNPRLRIILGQVLVSTNRTVQAMDVFEQVVEHDPNDNESQYALALLYLQLDKDEMASATLQKLVNIADWGERASFQLGRLNATKGNYKKAQIWFDKITQKPYVFDAKMSTVSLLLEQKKYQEAEQYVAQMDFNNQFQERMLTLVNVEILSKQKRYPEAYDLLTAKLEFMKDEKKLLYTRALIAEHLGRLDAMENDLLTILKKHPNDASTLNALGYTLADRDERLEEAEVYLTKAITFEPDAPNIIDSYGWLRFRQGRYEEALKFLRKAYDIKQEPETSGHMVEVLWMLNRKDEAREIYQESLQKFDDHEYLLHLKKEIDGL